MIVQYLPLLDLLIAFRNVHSAHDELVLIVGYTNLLGIYSLWHIHLCDILPQNYASYTLTIIQLVNTNTSLAKLAEPNSYVESAFIVIF